MHILLFILLFIFLIVFLALRLVFSIFNPRNYFRSNNKTEQRNSNSYYSSAQQQTSIKVFEKNEGEYVEFEEVVIEESTNRLVD
jgi:ABC-type multidrug transport system fused ATPase/permease subunit